MAIERYSHVMHIVSSVSGTLRDGRRRRWTRCARSCPPARSRGAPKVRAMEIIDELEPVKRGGYGGAIGYLSYSGDLDTCIHIRTVVIKDGTAHIQAGGGTVADAKPAYEYEESVNKAKAVKGAIELAARQRGLGMSTRVLMVGQLRLVHLQPGPVPRASWGPRSRSCATTSRPSTSCWSARPTASSSRPGRARPADAGISIEAMRRFPEAGIQTLGVCLGHQSLAEAFGGTVMRHEPIHGKTTDDRARRRGRLPRPARRADRRALPLAGRRRGGPAGRVHRHRARRRRPHGHPPPRAAGRGRAVPSRVGPHRPRARTCCATSCRTPEPSVGCPPFSMPNDVLTAAIDALASRRDLSQEQAGEVLAEIMAGNGVRGRRSRRS